MRQFIAPDKPAEHFDSDRDVLDFPRGGVFGQTSDQTEEAIDDALSLAGQLEAQLDDMQAQLDELASDLDKGFTFPGTSGDDTGWTPSAA
jgi:hypothetical protein